MVSKWLSLRGRSKAIDAVFKELEGTIDKYYEKVEKAQAKRPTEEW